MENWYVVDYEEFAEFWKVKIAVGVRFWV